MNVIHAISETTSLTSPSNQINELLQRLLLWVFDQQPCNKVSGESTGAAEVLLIELIVHSWHIGKCLLFIFTQERWGTTKPEDTEENTSKTHVMWNSKTHC